MDFFSHNNKPTSHPDPEKKEHRQPSSSELLSSAKLVANAANSTLRHESDKFDKAKVADAAADLLGAAQHYAKLEESKGLGKYVDKAEDYLHNYHSSHSTTTTTTKTTKPDSDNSSTTTTHTSTTHSSEGGDNSGSGYGGYMKMAEGFLKKH